MNPRRYLYLLSLIVCSGVAIAQSTDFLHPQQKGPFQVNGLAYVEVGPGRYTDPVNIGSSVPTIDQIIPELAATGANLVKISLTVGQVKNYNDNAYDPVLPFPLEGKSPDILAFGQKLTSQGISCMMQPFSGVENIIAGVTLDTSRVNPLDRRAFVMQHIPRLVSVAQLAEEMGCEYFIVFGDEIEHLVADPNLTDLWVQAITQVRKVFSGRLTSTSSWGEHGGGFSFIHQPQIISMLDVFGIGFFPAYTDHTDPTVSEIVASYTNNSQKHDSLRAVTDMRTLYQKPILVTDEAFGSFKGSNVQSDSVLFAQSPPGQFTVDYQEQANLYQGFFQVMPTLDPNWMLGAVLDSFDRLPYAWKDVNLPPYLGSLGESIRGKPALQNLTNVYQTSRAITTPANGWWYNPMDPGTFYALEAENGVVRLASLTYSAQGDPQWSLARCIQIVPGTYVGAAEQYFGGRALNHAPTPPTGIGDGPTAKLVFASPTIATLHIGAQNIPIQRYQFSDQWASPMLNAPRTGWWDQPSQSGRGYFLEVQGNSLFLGGLIYNSSGQPSWFSSTGRVDPTGHFSGNVSVCSAQADSAGRLQAPVCKATTDTIRLAFSTPWRATLTLDQESTVEIRRYRQTEIGWAGPAPAFPLPNARFPGQSATVNAATFLTGVAPGLVAMISGTGLTRGVSGVVQASTSPLPLSLHGTSVVVNGMAAPIFAIANMNGQEQIYFQVPWEVQGKPIPDVPFVAGVLTLTTVPAVSIVVSNNGAVSPAMRALFDNIQPTIITSQGLNAVALHADYSLITSQNPARSGEVISVYGIGFGSVTPSPATGAPAADSPPSTLNAAVSATINAHNAPVLFAGLSPGSVGVYQFKLSIPDRVGIGDLNVLINVGGQNSNLVTIPVK